MLTMILVFLAVGFYLSLLGCGLRILGRIIGWLIGVSIVVAVIGGIFGLIGAAVGLAVHAFPILLLVGIGVLIGRAMSGRTDRIDRFRDRAQDVIGEATGHIRGCAQDVVDAAGRVIR